MKNLCAILTGFILFSCDSQKVLLRSTVGKGVEYEIGQFNSGCCGCIALYYSSHENQKVKEQLIFETTCGIGKPTVFKFENEAGEKSTSAVKRFIAVSDTTSEVKFNTKQLSVLKKLDSIVLAQGIKTVPREFQFSRLTGYRTVTEGEQFHPFWISEKGKSVYQTN
ncbi:MAG: hypothetical protein KF856_03370 [Cyclobacteriaceae bacterium]|nr:hypothetical protein [Cyclobacteriaceae bacterium]